MKPVLIVGAGPTGMTAAMELARFGIPVRIVDKLLEPSTTSRALAVQARTLELLEQRGLAREMVQSGNQGNAATIYGDSKRLGKVLLSQIQSRYNYILLLSQSETERILREQLGRQGISIERGTELISFAQPESAASSSQNSVKTVLRHHDGLLEELDAAYVISAEGAHSTIRRTLNLEFKGKSLGESYALADLRLDGDIPDDELSIFLAKKGFLAVFPMGNRHFRFIATDPEKHEKTDSEPTLDELQRIYDADAYIAVRLRDMTWSSRFRINSRMLETLRERRIFFGGDAAHIHSPAGGQGMNTGIQDMIDLSWKLAFVMRGRANPELLNTYQEDRLPVIRSVVARTEGATNAFNSTDGIVHQLITHIAPVLLNTELVQRLSTGMISEIESNYRASSISTTSDKRGSLVAGDRVPDLDVAATGSDVSAETFPQRMFELLDPSRFTLLLVADAGTDYTSSAWEAPLAPWLDIVRIQRIAAAPNEPERTAFHKALGISGGVFLVRPDSYLAFVGDRDSLSSLSGWLQRWFPQAHEAATASRTS